MNQQLTNFRVQIAQIDLFNQVKSQPAQSLMELAGRNKQYQQEWDRVASKVRQMEIEQGLPELALDDKELDAVLEVTVMKAGQATPNAALMGDILDDLMLLARAIRVNYADSWLDMIWAEYQAGEFPRANLALSAFNSGTTRDYDGKG